MADAPPTPTSWVIRFDGQVFREEDLTIAEVEQMEEMTGHTWRFLNPLRSAGHAKATLTVLLVSRMGMTKDDALAKVGDIRALEFFDMISEVDSGADLPTEYEDGIPQPAAGTSTPT